MGNLNTRSLYPKIDEIRCIVDESILTFFCVNEIWLHEYIKNDEIRTPGHNVSRKDGTTGVGACMLIWEPILCSKTLRPSYGLRYDKVISNISYHVSTDVLLPRQNIMKKCWNVLGWLNIRLFLWVILILITFWMRIFLLTQSTLLKLHMLCTS